MPVYTAGPFGKKYFAKHEKNGILNLQKKFGKEAMKNEDRICSPKCIQ